MAGYVVRDPARRAAQLALAPQPRRRAARPGRRRHLRHRHPRADPAPARARRDAGRHLHRPRPTRTRCWSGCCAPAEMAGAELAGEVSTRRGLRRARRVGEKRFTVAALDLGIKAMTPAPDGRARHRGARAARDRDDRRRARRSRRTGCSSPTARATRPPPTDQVELLQGVLGARHPVLRDLLRQPAVRPRARLRHLQAEVRPPRHQPAGDGPHHRQGRGHRPQPRVRRRRAARRARRRRRTAWRR